MKVLISNRAWIEKSSLDPVKLFLLKKELTVHPKVMKGDGLQEFYLFKETPTHIGVPRMYFRLKFDPSNADISYNICEGKRLPPNSMQIELLEDQKRVEETVIRAITTGSWGSGLVEAFTGFGKSPLAISIVSKLARNTIILVHTEGIEEVWIAALNKFYPNASVGIVRSTECDYKKDFVIASVQSLMFDNGKYPEEMYSYFGTLFVDEVHRFGSEHFGSVVPKFNCRFMFGLSGTIRRSDGAENVFIWSLGQIIAKGDSERRVNPKIFLRNSGFVPQKLFRSEMVGGVPRRRMTLDQASKDVQRHQFLEWICASLPRQKTIVQDIIFALKKGRNPLVVSERKDPLYEISKLLDEAIRKDPFFLEKKITHGFYMGDDEADRYKKERLRAAAKCSVVYATLGMAKEGVDIPRLDTLFFVTPVSDPEQIIGRICRPTMIKNENGKMVVAERVEPIVFDYVDGLMQQARNQFRSRRRHYLRLKWHMYGYDDVDFGDWYDEER